MSDLKFLVRRWTGFFQTIMLLGDRVTTVYPNAADENEIVDWILRKFSKLEIKIFSIRAWAWTQPK